MKQYEGEDKVEFAKTMAALALAYGKTLTEELLRIYSLGLSDVPIAQVKRKALDHMRDNKYFPRIAELRPVTNNYHREWKRKAAISAHRTREDQLRLAKSRAAYKALPSPRGATKSLGALVKR